MTAFQIILAVCAILGAAILATCVWLMALKLKHRGEVADHPNFDEHADQALALGRPVKSCLRKREPHPCNRREFHPDDPLAAMELDASDVKIPRGWRRG